MPNFSVSAVETLDYDFTEIPSNSGKGMCKGRGTIPEPSQPRLEAYSAAVRELYAVDATKDVHEAIDADAQAKEKAATLLLLTADLCQNSPSQAELTDLPPRYCRGFMKWIFSELADPKVSNAATRS